MYDRHLQNRSPRDYGSQPQLDFPEPRPRRRTVRNLALWVAVIAVLLASFNPTYWLGCWVFRWSHSTKQDDPHDGAHGSSGTPDTTNLAILHPHKSQHHDSSLVEPSKGKKGKEKTSVSSKKAPPGAESFAAVLAEKLPLHVSSMVVPDYMEGRQTITVVFNRAIIPLGSNFGPETSKGIKGVRVNGRDPLLWQCENGTATASPPVEGRARWVTTSILRFDPTEDWPTDLSCVVKVNAKLKSFDGIPLAPGERSAKFATPPLTMTLVEVTSKRAQELTGGTWTSMLYGDAMHECPPDAMLQLSFNTAVDAQLLKGKLVLVDSRGHERHVTVSTDDSCTQCTSVKVKLPHLEVGAKYSLQLPPGSKVSRSAGPISSSLTVDVMGLHPFSIPWDQHATTKISHVSQWFWVRHGLPASSDLEELQKVITISPPITWKLRRISESILSIDGTFQPHVQYNIHVASHAGIVDGFGLPLVASNVSKEAAPISSYLVGPQSFVVTAAQPPDIQTLGRAPHKSDGADTVSAIKLRPLSEADVLNHLHKLTGWCPNPNEIFFERQDTIVIQPEKLELQEFRIPGERLFGLSGVFAQHAYQVNIHGGASWGSCSLFTHAAFGVTTLLTNEHVTVWVTSITDAQGLQGATVKLLRQSQYDQPYSITAEKQTNKEGLVEFQNVPEGSANVMVVKDGRMSFTTIYVPSPPSYLLFGGDVVTDRKLYRAGEEVHVKGYIQAYDTDGKAKRVSAFPNEYLMKVYWDQEMVSIPVQLDSTFGTFHTSLQIPDNAKYGVKQLHLYTSPGQSYIAETYITIADPRIPTGILEFSAEAAVYRLTDKTLPLNIATKLYTGTLAKESAVTLRWRVGDFSGEEVVKLPEGHVQHPFRLPSSVLEKTAAARQNLHIKAEWFTATRDLLTQEVYVLVAESAWQSSLVIPEGSKDVIPGHVYDAKLTLTISGPTKVTTEAPPLVEFRMITEPHKAGKDAELFRKGAPIGSAAQYEWTKMSPKTTIVSATVQFTVPSMGHFLLIVQFTDDAGVVQYASEQLGKTEAEWKRSPLLKIHHLKAMEFEAQEYTVGSKVTLRWVSPFKSARALVQWGGQSTSSLHQELMEVVHGENFFHFTLTSDCTTDCQVIAAVVTPQQAEVIVPVPVSPMLDMTLPKQVTLGPLTVPIATTNYSLAVGLSTPSLVVPGSTVDLSFDIPLEDGEKGEVAVMVVNKALLDLKPSPLPTTLALQTPFQASQRQLSANSLYSSLVSDTMVYRAYNLTKERQQKDPWLQLNSWRLSTGSDLDQDTESFLRCQYNSLTALPPNHLQGSGCQQHWFPMAYGVASMASDHAPRMMAAAVPMPSRSAVPRAMGMAKGAMVEHYSAAAGSGQQSVAIPTDILRTDFKATAMFIGSLLVNKEGKAETSFTVPDNIGTWVIRALVVVAASDGTIRKYGTAEKDMVAKRPLSLFASLPRIARVGDIFQAGCTITSSHTGEVTVGTKMAGNSSALEYAGPTQVTVSVKADVPREVIFHFTCITVGTTMLQFIAQQGGQETYADAFQQEVPGLGLQDPVSLATSFAITAIPAGAPEQRDEGMEFPEALPGTGKVTITAGVGRYPTIQGLTTAVLQQAKKSRSLYDWVWATDLLAVAMVHHVNKGYGAAKEEIETYKKESLAALKELSLYCSHMGLFEMPVAKTHYPWVPVMLNIFGIFVWNRIGQQTMAQATIQETEYGQWQHAVQQELHQLWAHNGTYRWGILTEVYLAYGLKDGPSWLLKDYPLVDLINISDSLSDYHRATLLIVICEGGVQRKYHSFVQRVAEDLYNNLRTTGRTAYLSHRGSSGGAQSLAANAMALWALAISGQYSQDPLVEKLANYVSQSEVAGHGVYACFSSKTAVYQMLALTKYDAVTGSTNPDLHLEVLESHSGKHVLRQHFTSNALLPAKMETEWEALSPAEAPNLQFFATGQGEASVVLGLDFVPRSIFSSQVYYGIYVEKTMVILNQHGSSLKYDPSMALKAGQTVKVIIQVTTPDDLHHTVIVTDPLPGCLEALDPNLDWSVHHVHYGLRPNPQLWYPYDPERWAFPSKEVKKERVTFLAPHLWAGSHTCSYEAVVVTSGSFQVPPAKAHLSTQPEVMGLSNTYTITVAKRS